MTDVAQIRINDLARELEVKAKAIVDLLPTYGVTEKKTHSSSIPADVAERVRKELTRRAKATKEAAARAASAQPAAQPSVYISYVPEDVAWRERIAAYLTGVGFYVPDDPKARTSGPFQGVLRPIREQAQVYILLVSPHYLGSDQIRETELPHIRPLSQARKRIAISVILEPCPWQSFKDLPKVLVLPDGGRRTLSAGNEERIMDDLHTLAREVRQAIRETDKATALPESEQAPDVQSDWIDQPTFDRFSGAARTVLALAQAIGRSSETPAIHTQLLLLAFRELALKDEAASRTKRETPRELTAFLTAHDKDLVQILAPLPPLQQVVPPPLTSPPRLSLNARRALQTAIGEAGPFDPIEDSHVLFGVLSSTRNAKVRELNSRGMTPGAVPLPSTDASVSAQPSVLAGYQSDDPSGTDLLGIGDEVRALASVLAAKDVDPPLSLGLSGDWGTGKSFFMNKLECEIKRLGEDAKKAKEQGVESAYCSNIVQITFNAWNYVDSDLWASLTSEIFENLAAAIVKERGMDKTASGRPRDPEELAAQRELVLAAASSSEAILEEAERKKASAEQELKQTEERLANLQRSEAAIESSLTPGEILKQTLDFAMRDEKMKEYVGAISKTLRIPETEAAASEVQSEIRQLHNAWSTIFFTLKNERRIWIWFAALGLALISGSLVTRLLTQLGTQTLVSRVVAALTVASTLLIPFVNTSRRVLSVVQGAKESRKTAD
jgi:hypothetical protein